MPDEPEDKPARQSIRAPRDTGQASPTIRSFPAVRPEGTVSSPAATPGTEDELSGPSQRELTLAVMKLAEQVEQLGGDVGDVRYLLGMVAKKGR